jgi:hypothetical protein
MPRDAATQDYLDIIDNIRAQRMARISAELAKPSPDEDVLAALGFEFDQLDVDYDAIEDVLLDEFHADDHSA